MLYENTLLKSFNEGYEDILVKEEKLRKDIANMIYCFYTNNKSAINGYLKEYMLNSSVRDLKVFNTETSKIITIPDESNPVGMFSEKSVKIMPKIHIDLVNKVLDMTCTIYNGGADRYLINKDGKVNEEETTKLLNIYNGFNINKKIVDIYKQGYLFNTILTQVVNRNGKIDIDIITPNFASVEPDNLNYLKAKIILIAKSVNNEDVIVYWSDTEHFYINSEGEKAEIKEGEITNNYKNPFGSIPFAVCRFNVSSDFWGEPQQDLIENNIWYDVGESNMLLVEMFQGLGVGVGVNLGKQGTLTVSPNTLILVDNVIDGQIPPTLEFSSTNAPLTELQQNQDYRYKRIGNSKGLSAQSLSNEAVSQSGVAKIMDSQEIMIKKDTHKEIMKVYENELYEKIKLVHNYYFPKEKFSDDLKFMIDYKEDEPMASVTDELAMIDFRLSKNLLSIEDLAIRDNPELSIEQAQEMLMRNKAINEKYSINIKKENESEKETRTAGTDN